MLYRLAADAVLIVHAGFIAFVVLGLVLVLLGWALRWRWVRNAWFRAAHLAAIAYVVAQAWLGIVCPLTTLENRLRVLGGQRPYSGNGFIADWLHHLLFFRAEPWVFAVCYTAFGLLVVATLVFVPPRRKRRRQDGRADDGHPPTLPGAVAPR